MLDKLKLFKSTDRPAAVVTNGKRTSSSSGVSSARSEKSDSSASLEPNIDLKPIRNNSRVKQQRPTKTTVVKSSPVPAKKEGVSKPTKTAQDVEKHAHKVANLSSKLAEPKVKVPSSGAKHNEVKNSPLPTNHNPNTGIPKPTAAIKGTSKPARDDKSAVKSPTVSRESSQASISTKPTVALVSPMKVESNQLSESSHSASTGHHSNSSESSVIYKPSSESGSEHNGVIPNRKEGYLPDLAEQPSFDENNVGSDKSIEENLDHKIEIKREDIEPTKGIKTKPDAFPQNFPNKDLYENLQHDQLYHQTNNVYHQHLHHNHRNNLSPCQLTPTEKNHAYQNKIIQEIYQEEKQLNTLQHAVVNEEDTIGVEPMRPLLRGYCSTLTLPARPGRHYQRVQPDGGADYCEISLVNGYLSDGEMLRNPAAREICDGYMSEGGAVLYARRLQTMPAQLPTA